MLSFESISPMLAYLDPGTGSIILQIAAAAILSVGVMCRRYLFVPLSWMRKSNAAEQDME